MKEIIFKGNYIEIGRQLGKIYRKNGKFFGVKRFDKKLYSKQLSFYKKFCPELLEEIKGISEGGNYNYENVVYENITGEIDWYKNKIKKTSCTIFGVKNKFGTFIGRNYDWYPETIPLIYKYINSQSYNYTAITDNNYYPGFKKEDQIYYIDDAINEKGLYIGITFAFGSNTSYGLSSMHIRKLIIEKCKTVSEALIMFKKIPVCCPKNFFIADKNGEMVIVEHSSGKNYKVIRPNDGVLIKTNHYLDQSLAKQDLILKNRPANSTYVRYYELLRNINLIGVDKIKQKNITELILDKKSYIRQNSATSNTIWSLSMDMKKGEYDLYYKGKKKKIVV
ncbi:MAG: C45 family peptidase [Minisyncoccia bacterium]